MPFSSRRWVARAQLLGAAALFSTGGAVIKATALTGWQVAAGRSFLAALFLLLAVPSSRRQWNRRTWLVGLAYAATLVLFVLANKRTTAAHAIFLQSTAPLYVLLLAPMLLKEAIRVVDLGVLAVIGTGIWLLVGSQTAAAVTAPDPATGNVLAALCGFTWALTLLGLRWQSRTGHAAGTTTVVVGNVLVVLFCLAYLLPFPGVSGRDLGVLLFLGIFQVGLAYLLLTRGLEQVPALEASLLLMLEPVLNPLWAWLVHGEQPGAAALAGGALVLAAGLGRAWWQRSPS